MNGVDVVIEDIRSALETQLLPLVTNKVFYGRTYRNMLERDKPETRRQDEQLIAEIYIGDGEYQEIMFDDSLNVLCFFDVEENIEQANFEEQPIRDVNIIFAFNLEAIYGTRDTEQAYFDVYQVLNQFSMLIDIDRVITGLPAYGDLSTERLKEYNMQPYHTFAFQTSVKVSYSNC